MDLRRAMEARDIGALSQMQQEQLGKFKIDTRIDNEKYLRSHPEVEILLEEFLREVFMKRPEDIREFAAGKTNVHPLRSWFHLWRFSDQNVHFTDPDLPERIKREMEERKA